MWPFPLHIPMPLCYMLNKRKYYVPAPPVKGQKWTKFLSAERINQDYVSWKESQTAVARRYVSVSVCVSGYSIFPSVSEGWEIWSRGKHLLVDKHRCYLGSKKARGFVLLFMYLPTAPHSTSFVLLCGRIGRALIIISAEMIRRSNRDRMPFPSINAGGLECLSQLG